MRTDQPTPLVPRIDGPPRPDGPSLSALYRRYIDTQLSTARPATLCNHRRTLALCKALGDHPNTAEIATWLARLAATMAPTTVNAHRANLCAVYTAAHLAGLTRSHPCARDLRWPRPIEQPRALSPGALPALVAVLAELPARHALFLGLCRYAGLRCGEALAVTPADLTEKTIRIERHRPKPNAWDTTPTKTAAVRTLPIRAELRDLLAPVLDEGPAEVRAGRGAGLRRVVPFLCPLRGQDLYGPSSTMRAALAKADPEHLGSGDAYHVLRHTFAVELVDAGLDLREIRDVLGHDSVAHTERYTIQLRGRRVRPDIFAKVENNGRAPASKHMRTDHATKKQPPTFPVAP